VLHLGSNCGDPMANLRLAIAHLNKSLGVAGVLSSYYQTAAWGKRDQDDFINVALAYDLNDNWDAFELLKLIVGIETTMKRERFEKWGPRIIDIDIIYLGNEIIKNKVLEVPHPLMQERGFVLVPLNDIIPNFEHPVFHKTTAELLGELEDDLEVCKIA
jgi:2-amino-4-hydroxy-6-hydroxymethyldihydropteridine diphosphokinase